MTELMKPGEVADALNISKRQVHHLIASGELTAVRIGIRVVRVSRASVNALLVRGSRQPCK